MGGMSLSSPVPTPSQSKMALTRQRKLPRKHSPKQHAELVFGGVGGSTSYSNLERNTSSGVESSDSNFPNIGVSNDRNYQVPRNSSGISTSSSVSKSEGGTVILFPIIQWIVTMRPGHHEIVNSAMEWVG
eukprot:g2444.t1 g2444   contig12:133751-134140(+)